jgi:pimeloyl-ACP methyl ester carboxylesterase
MTRPDILDEPWVHASGAGEPAVLVHGIYPGSPDDFAPQQPLADTTLLVAIDRRGYGANPDRGGPLGWPADCEDLLRLLEALGGAHLVGHSYGGTVAGLAASRRPDLVGSLVLVEPALHTVVAGDPDVADLLAREAEVAEVADSAATAREWARAWVMRVVGADRDGTDGFLGIWGSGTGRRRPAAPGVTAPAG